MRKNNLAHITIALLGLLTSALAHELFVIHPHDLARKFNFNSATNKGQLESSLANFGHYDKTGIFQGRVHYPLVNQDGCNPFNETDFDDQHLKEASFDGHKNVIMVDRGNCHFVKKVQNIQKFGGVLAIIVDKNDQVSTHMSDDGKGGSVNIPSFLIGQRDGRVIKEAVHEMEMQEIKQASQDKKSEGPATDADSTINIHKSRDFANNEDADREEHYKKSGHQVIIQAFINGKIGKRDTVNIDLWYNNAYELFTAGWKLKEFAKMQDIFHRHVKVKFQPRSLYRKGEEWPEMVSKGQCIRDGQYCFDIGEVYAEARMSDSENAEHDYRGQGMANQVVREQCMYEAMQGEKSHWFRFMDAMIEGCIKQKNSSIPQKAKLITDSCFDKSLKFSTVYSKFDESKYIACYKSQKALLLDASYSNTEIFLNRDRQKRNEMSVQMHPSITVNGQKFEGDYRNTNELFKMICSKLEDRPEECKSMGLTYQKEMIIQEYINEYGEEGSVERAVTTFDRIKEKQQKDQDVLSVHERTTTKMDLVIVLICFSIATGIVFYCKNYRDKNDHNQQMHDAVNAQVSQYFQMTAQSQIDNSQN